jgi:hypothetical protein
VQEVAHPPDQFVRDMLAAASRSAERRRRAVSPIRGPQHVERVLELCAAASLLSFVAVGGEG